MTFDSEGGKETTQDEADLCSHTDESSVIQTSKKTYAKTYAA